MKKKICVKKEHLFLAGKTIFWFCAGAMLALFFLISFSLILFQKYYGNKIYPGVVVGGMLLGGKTQEAAEKYFIEKNTQIKESIFVFTTPTSQATISAQQLHLGYDSKLMITQAYSIGRSPSLFSNMTLIFQAYFSGIHLYPAYYYDETKLVTALNPIMQETYKAPINAVFTMQNNKVTSFHPSSNGEIIDINLLKQKVFSYVPFLVSEAKPKQFTIPIPMKVIKPDITTENSNRYGIRELIGEGTSWFQHSIQSRIYNVTLASTKINGTLIAPSETFSFDKALGDVSKFTGYQEAYVIQDGKTVLGDGGGVCQVSTTFFRALLNAGVPITERHGHAYRVGYYEEGNYPPGIDATIYVPNVDLKFKNDTGHWILALTTIDPNDLKLTVDLYGTADGRTSIVSKPVVSNETPAPPPLFQDDPTLPKGQVRQVDFAAPGAHISFNRQVTKDGKTLLSDTFITDYKPWQAVYLRGTQ